MAEVRHMVGFFLIATIVCCPLVVVVSICWPGHGGLLVYLPAMAVCYFLGWSPGSDWYLVLLQAAIYAVPLTALCAMWRWWQGSSNDGE